MTAGQAIDRIRLPGPFGFFIPSEDGPYWIVNEAGLNSLDLLCRIRTRHPRARIELWYEDARRRRKAAAVANCPPRSAPHD